MSFSVFVEQGGCSSDTGAEGSGLHGSVCSDSWEGPASLKTALLQGWIPAVP